MSRTYDIEGKQYPSVTTVLDILDKPALKQWAVNMACDYIAEALHADVPTISEKVEEARTEWKNQSQEALDIGSEVHEIIEEHIAGNPALIDQLRPEVIKAYEAFCKWEEENIDCWLHSEMTVYSHQLCIAGTLDAVAKLKDGRTVVIDFKSSKGFYEGYGEQTAIYRHCYESMNATDLDGNLVLRLDKVTGMPEAKDYSDKYDQQLFAFIKLLDYWYAAKKRRCKNKRTAK